MEVAWKLWDPRNQLKPRALNRDVTGQGAAGEGGCSVRGGAALLKGVGHHQGRGLHLSGETHACPAAWVGTGQRVGLSPEPSRVLALGRHVQRLSRRRAGVGVGGGQAGGRLDGRSHKGRRGKGCRAGSPRSPCAPQDSVCRRTLRGPGFAPCNQLVDPEAYVAACAQDLCRCPSCPCATFTEYSRQCAHAGGWPQSWRGPDLCRECPSPGLGQGPPISSLGPGPTLRRG